MKLINELLSLIEDSGLSLAGIHAKLMAADDDTVLSKAEKDLLEKQIVMVAEQHVMDMVVNNPDDFGVDIYDYDEEEREEVLKNGTHIHVATIYACKNGYELDVRIDTDDIGGSSDNDEELKMTIDGKVTNANVGERVLSIEGSSLDID